MKKAAFTNSFVSSAAKASAIFGVDYQRGKSGTPQKRMERRWLNETAQKRAAAAVRSLRSTRWPRMRMGATRYGNTSG